MPHKPQPGGAGEPSSRSTSGTSAGNGPTRQIQEGKEVKGNYFIFSVSVTCVGLDEILMAPIDHVVLCNPDLLQDSLKLGNLVVS
ncbi:hypothetical protein CBOM_01611 [Ceraceosorus bombacis]|uniref:Uncharacterized protein n=1 Tax=Ceraceosorus bombacis TaxID=401625 RepID=A0A0P1BCG8_9BASI|nr:hypothetical protein CBOM_01611 [Ceraceosorus bombacis]